MKLKFCYCLSLFFWFLKIAFANDVVRVDDNFYTAQSATKESLYFAMERIELETGSFDAWSSYSRYQINKNLSINAALFWEPSPLEQMNESERRLEEMGKDRKLETEAKWGSFKEILKSAPDPLGKFGDCLLYHDRAEVWVAYARSDKPKERYKTSDIRNIEMAVAVLTDRAVPFELHMGISRGILYLESGNLVHKDLASELHAFAAKVMKSHDVNKRYLITTPMKAMKTILVKMLPQGSHWEGQNQDSSLIHTVGENPYESGFRFSLLDDQGKLIFEANQCDAGKKYWWFFSNTQPTSTHPYFIVDLEKLASLF